MEFKKYHKIGQFRDCIRNISMKSDFKGLDNDGEPIYEASEKPTITFEGTVKVHGTNAGVCYKPGEGIKNQKRSNFCGDALKEHFEFSRFALVTHKYYFTDVLVDLHDDLDLDDDDQITLYGEYAGNGIQKGVAVSEIPKSFFAFGIKVYNNVTSKEYWVENYHHLLMAYPRPKGIYDIHEFKTFELDIDFNNPLLITQEMEKLVLEVEAKCPVGYHLGVEGVGEGIVWKAFYEGEELIFKTKGEKHSVSKVKTLVAVDPELLKSISEFVSYACTENRVKQAMQETDAKDRSDTGDVLRWVANDIIAEENDVLVANNLEWKQVARGCSQKVRVIFFKLIDSI